jgi:hypothetical protein
MFDNFYELSIDILKNFVVCLSKTHDKENYSPCDLRATHHKPHGPNLNPVAIPLPFPHVAPDPTQPHLRPHHTNPILMSSPLGTVHHSHKHRTTTSRSSSLPLHHHRQPSLCRLVVPA